MKGNRQEIITFKVDAFLLDSLKDMPNRSEFIRSALLTALGSACPLCGGAGVLNAHQKAHWEEFRKSHSVQRCGKCQQLRLVCTSGPEDDLHNARTGRRR